MNGKYITKEEALKRLQMTSEELDRLVSEGELRAFRDGGVIRFKAEDIEELKKRSETEATVVLGADAKKSATPPDDETSEVDLDSVEVESEADESDQTSILPLDVPGEKEEEEAPVMELDEAGDKEGPSLAAVLEEAPTVERPKKKGDVSDIASAVLDEKAAETDHGIDLAEVQKSAGRAGGSDVASSLLDIVEEEKKKRGITGLLKAAEKETDSKPSVTAETVGLEPATESELGTVAIEPVEAGSSEETVPMEAAVEEAATEPGIEPVGGAEGPAVVAGGALTLEDFLQDVQPEGALVKFGLLVTAVVMVYAAILVYNLHAGTNNALTRWLTEMLGKSLGQ